MDDCRPHIDIALLALLQLVLFLDLSESFEKLLRFGGGNKINCTVLFRVNRRPLGALCVHVLLLIVVVKSNVLRFVLWLLDAIIERIWLENRRNRLNKRLLIILILLARAVTQRNQVDDVAAEKL